MYINLNDNQIMQRMGVPFWPYAWWFQIGIKQADVEYIESVIKKDKCFPFILSAYKRAKNYKISHLDRAYAKVNIIVFLDKFYNDPKCPNGVKLTLFCILGLYRDYVAEYSPSFLSERYTFVERWLETVK